MRDLAAVPRKTRARQLVKIRRSQALSAGCPNRATKAVGLSERMFLTVAFSVVGHSFGPPRGSR